MVKIDGYKRTKRRKTTKRREIMKRKLRQKLKRKDNKRIKRRISQDDMTKRMSGGNNLFDNHGRPTNIPAFRYGRVGYYDDLKDKTYNEFVTFMDAMLKDSINSPQPSGNVDDPFVHAAGIVGMGEYIIEIPGGTQSKVFHLKDENTILKVVSCSKVRTEGGFELRPPQGIQLVIQDVYWQVRLCKEGLSPAFIYTDFRTFQDTKGNSKTYNIVKLEKHTTFKEYCRSNSLIVPSYGTWEQRSAVFDESKMFTTLLKKCDSRGFVIDDRTDLHLGNFVMNKAGNGLLLIDTNFGIPVENKLENIGWRFP